MIARPSFPLFFGLLLALVAVTPLAMAQGQGDDPSKVEFRVTRFDPGDAPPPSFRAGARGSSLEFNVPLTHIAGPFEAPLREGMLDLWRGEAETPEISIPIAPEEREHLLLVFLPRAEGFQVMKVRTPPTRIRGGDRLIINATQSPLAFQLGDMGRLLVNPSQSEVLRGPASREIVSLPVLVHRRIEERWELASSEQWPCDPRFRRILFAYICPRREHLAFHVVSERLE